MTKIVLDISRLLSRVFHATPTGVDRCEMAYARGLLARAGGDLSFAAVHPCGLYGRLPKAAVVTFLAETERRWEQEGHLSRNRLWRQAGRSLTALFPRPIGRRAPDETIAYIKPSPNGLTDAARLTSILRRERGKLICLVHDIIPLEFPEYARPNGADLHRRRIETIAALADGIITNSTATLRSIGPWIDRGGRDIVRAVAHLGVDLPDPPLTLEPSPDPYYVCIGTIEPRKNHLLLLNLWRRMAQERGAANVPQLVLIGRRGWENEQIVDMLDRCPALVGCVEERTGLPDAAVWRLLAGARALLLPSFAEGYGMPVREASALGVPVICSDLPSLREAGGDHPTYLDPLDGPAWLAAIDRHAAFPRRSAPAQDVSWKNHLDTVMDVVNEVGR